ncbi:uncharacterized protein LOC127875447 [Dreissena polymorpha]|uniref:Uncharacterized protein n=1 Tax=Dreissena polymorpha TaxID=45954 RepID=A0A9D4R4L2_DREPO|nr:uncharacterized protein LOC127875447 [Dreissena polymorpha]KAH3854038.1 hypothetical protein DPMN_096577 [Dreissena polymorpha]
MGFNTSSVWIKVAIICLALALLLFVIGFATTHWMVLSGYRSSSYGLWSHEYCDHHRCADNKITGALLRQYKWEDWYRATQAFECIGLICLSVALLVIILFVFVDRMRKRNPLIAIIILSFCAVVAMVIGFLIFALKLEDYGYSVGWSMALAIAGCILTFVAGVMCVIDLKK